MHILFFIAIMGFITTNAQYVVISDDSTYVPTSSNVVLDIYSANANKGILVPRLTTTQRLAISTSSPSDDGLLVYDTDTQTFWYWNGSNWIEISDKQQLSLSGTTLSISGGNSVNLSSAITSTAWSLTGNSGTTAGTNFLGTTDNVSLSFKTNNTERMRILNTGNVGIGTTSPSERLDVSGNIKASDIVYWGTDGIRTEVRDDAGAYGPGIRSGFYQTASPSPAANWPTGATGWWFLLDLRHTNTANNYALQFAGSFFDQKLYFRKTNNNSSQTWTEVITSSTETYEAISLGTNIEISSSTWTDIPGMTLTFVAKKSTAMIMLTASGHGYTNSMSYVSLRVYNTTTGTSLGGTSNKIQAYDDVTGTVTVWNATYSKVITGLTPGATYTIKVQGQVDGIYGTYNAVIYPVTYPDDEHMTLSVFY